MHTPLYSLSKLAIRRRRCDDGNTVNGDGCSATCTLETGYGCFNGQLLNDTDVCARMRSAVDSSISQKFRLFPP